MADTIAHRGPDDEGFFSVPSLGWAVNLGMRRLSIIDREHGHQPMHCGRATIVGNHEIYNHRRLRHNLTVTGVPCKTHCDTEVIGRLWDKEGVSCLDQLQGMFAFALWDRVETALYLVRDRLGKKPLYYYHSGNLLVFASELKALLAHPRVPKKLNHEGIYHYLSLQYIPEPMTAYEGIHCVPPGSYVKYCPKTNSMEVVQWWSLNPDRKAPVDPVNCTRVIVEEAIKSRLESEVPLGVYLSGGIDSAIVTGVAKQACEELHTFSMGFEEESYSELDEAKRTAEHFGTIHHEAMVRIPQLPEMTRRIIDTYDQPYGDCSAIPTMLLAEASKQYITVALTGDGGDEAFGGYQRYWMAKPNIAEYTNWLAVIPFHIRDKMLGPAFKERTKSATHTRAWLLQKALEFKGGVRNQMAWMDMQSYLPNDIIVKMERATMATSVEARCPFLDHRVVQLACAIPDNQKIQTARDVLEGIAKQIGGFEQTAVRTAIAQLPPNAAFGKVILKRAFHDILPPEVMVRPKRGFGVPMNEWLRSEIGEQMLTEMMTDLNWPWDIFEPAAVTGLVESHLKGKANIGHAVWLILVLHLWLKKHFG